MKFRTMAEKLAPTIADKLGDRQTNTPKRQKEAAYARLEGQRLERTRDILLWLAGCYETDTVPAVLADVKTKKQIYDMARSKLTSGNGYYDASTCTGEPAESDIATTTAWSALSGKTPEEVNAEELRREIEGLQFANIPGYYPTPPAVVSLMIEAVGNSSLLWSEVRILEPSAGSGNICDALVGQDVDPDRITTFERNVTLSGILKRKGYNVAGGDFMAEAGRDLYDVILMNPPFERQQDIDHVVRAWQVLAEDGILVAIMSPAYQFRSDKKSAAFREFLSAQSESEDILPAGSFKQSGTNVNTVMVVLRK